jgi:spermidine/putrescine transport system substrate-binding protein
MTNFKIIFLMALVFLLTSCQGNAEPDLAKEISLYDWENDLPQEVLTRFEQEYHVKVNYITYKSQEEALEKIRHGLDVDLVVFDSRFVPVLIQESLLEPLSYENIPNFRFISPSFRDLVYDSGNRYSIPYSWGTIGLVVRSELAEIPIQGWSDLWSPERTSKIGLWKGEPRLVIGLALKSLGFSANSETLAELEAAAEKLAQIRPDVIFYEDYDDNYISPTFMSGDVAVGMGYAGDFLAARQDIDSLTYILPEEGALLWGDTFVIPRSGKEKYTAEIFLNFLLEPGVSALIVNYNRYATANLNAFGKINPGILEEQAIFPPQDQLTKVESILPVSEETKKIHAEIWEKFLAGSE